MSVEIKAKLHVRGPGFNDSVAALFRDIDQEISLTAPKHFKIRPTVRIFGPYNLTMTDDLGFVYNDEDLLATFKLGVRESEAGRDYFLRRIQ